MPRFTSGGGSGGGTDDEENDQNSSTYGRRTRGGGGGGETETESNGTSNQEGTTGGQSDPFEEGATGSDVYDPGGSNGGSSNGTTGPTGPTGTTGRTRGSPGTVDQETGGAAEGTNGGTGTAHRTADSSGTNTGMSGPSDATGGTSTAHRTAGSSGTNTGMSGPSDATGGTSTAHRTAGSSGTADLPEQSRDVTTATQPRPSRSGAGTGRRSVRDVGDAPPDINTSNSPRGPGEAITGAAEFAWSLPGRIDDAVGETSGQQADAGRAGAGTGYNGATSDDAPASTSVSEFSNFSYPEFNFDEPGGDVPRGNRAGAGTGYQTDQPTPNISLPENTTETAAAVATTAAPWAFIDMPELPDVEPTTSTERSQQRPGRELPSAGESSFEGTPAGAYHDTQQWAQQGRMDAKNATVGGIETGIENYQQQQAALDEMGVQTGPGPILGAMSPYGPASLLGGADDVARAASGGRNVAATANSATVSQRMGQLANVADDPVKAMTAFTGAFSAGSELEPGDPTESTNELEPGDPTETLAELTAGSEQNPTELEPSGPTKTGELEPGDPTGTTTELDGPLSTSNLLQESPLQEQEEDDDLGVPEDPWRESDKRLFDPSREFGDLEDPSSNVDPTNPSGVSQQDIGSGVAGDVSPDSGLHDDDFTWKPEVTKENDVDLFGEQAGLYEFNGSADVMQDNWLDRASQQQVTEDTDQFNQPSDTWSGPADPTGETTTMLDTTPEPAPTPPGGTNNPNDFPAGTPPENVVDNPLQTSNPTEFPNPVETEYGYPNQPGYGYGSPGFGGGNSLPRPDIDFQPPEFDTPSDDFGSAQADPEINPILTGPEFLGFETETTEEFGDPSFWDSGDYWGAETDTKKKDEENPFGFDFGSVF